MHDSYSNDIHWQQIGICIIKSCHYTIIAVIIIINHQIIITIIVVNEKVRF